MKGTRGLALLFQVLANVTKPDEPITCQFPRKTVLWLTPKTFHRQLQILQSFGYPGNDFGGVDPGREGYHSFRGVETVMDCKHEMDPHEQLQEKWEAVRAEVKITNGSAFDEFDEMLRAEQIAKDKRAARDSRRAEDADKDAVAVGNGITDDDIPF